MSVTALRKPRALAFLSESIPISSLPIAQLFVETDYGRQRPAPSEAWVAARSGKNYRPSSMRPIEVADLANGSYAVIDGQGRLLIAKESGVSEMECRIHTGVSPQERSQLFLDLNDSRKLSAIDIFRCRVGAGEKKANRVNSILAAHNFTIGGQGKEGIRHIATIEHVFDDPNLGPDVLNTAARVTRGGWPASLFKPNGMDLAGVALFIGATPSLDIDGVVKVLQKHGPTEIHTKMRDNNGGRTPRTDQYPMLFATYLQQRYNNRRGHHRSHPDKLDEMKNHFWK